MSSRILFRSCGLWESNEVVVSGGLGPQGIIKYTIKHILIKPGSNTNKGYKLFFTFFHSFSKKMLICHYPKRFLLFLFMHVIANFKCKVHISLLIFRPFLTLPRSSALVNWISVRFYETGCIMHLFYY